jgi:hypothetical protein
MDPVRVAAEFAAFVWFVEGEMRPRQEALRLARASWGDFLSVANPGLGRLLVKLARAPRTRARRGKPRTPAARRHELVAAQ